MVYRQHIDVQYETDCTDRTMAPDAAAAMAANDFDDHEGAPLRLTVQEAYAIGTAPWTVHLRVVVRHQFGHENIDPEALFHRCRRAKTVAAGEGLMRPEGGSA